MASSTSRPRWRWSVLFRALKPKANKMPARGGNAPRPTGYIILVNNRMFRHEAKWKAANKVFRKLQRKYSNVEMLSASHKRLYKKAS